MFWWIDRWRKSSAFMDMTLEEQAAYRNLLDEAHLRGGPLPNDERILAKACGDALAWERVRTAVIARFYLQPDGWHNETLDEIYTKSAELSYERSEAGRIGGLRSVASKRLAKVQAKVQAKGQANVKSPSPSPSPSLISVSDSDSEEKIKTVALRAPDHSLFELFWLAYPKKVGKGAALKAWTKLKPSQTLLETMVTAVQVQIAWPQWQKENGQFIPHPATWLNQGRWQDEGSKPVAANAPQLLSDQGKQNFANGQAAIAMIRGQRR